MKTAILERTSSEELKRAFGIKSYDEVLSDLATSREQAKSGKLMAADDAIKGLRAKYGL